MGGMTDKEFENRIDKARLRVVEMDLMDGAADRGLRTILAAMEAGIKNPDSGAQFDAVAMLRDIAKNQPKRLAE